MPIIGDTQGVSEKANLSFVELSKNISKNVTEAKKLVNVLGEIDKTFTKSNGVKTNRKATEELTKAEINYQKVLVSQQKTLQEQIKTSQQSQKVSQEKLKTNQQLAKSQQERLKIELQSEKVTQTRMRTEIQARKETERLAKEEERKAKASEKTRLANEKAAQPLARLNKLRNDAQNRLKQLIAAEELTGVKTKQTTREVQRAQREFDKLDKSFIRVQRSARQFQDNVGNYPKLFGSATNAVKGLVAAFGVVGGIQLFARAIQDTFRRIREFDKELQNIAGIAGVTREDLKPLEKQIIAVAGSSVKTSNEVAKLASTLITLGNTQEDVIKLLKPVNDLSIALQTTSEEAADFLGQTLNAFGRGAESADEFADIIANVRSSTSLDFQRIKDAFGFVAPTANALGISVGRLGAQVGTLQDNGIKAARAGRLLNTSFARLITQGLSLDEALEKINQSQDKVKTATELFGAESFTLGLILAENTEKVDRLADEFDNLSEGSLKTLTDEQLKSLDARLKILDSTWEQFILSIENGDGIISKVTKTIIDFATGILNTYINLQKITDSDYLTFWEKTQAVIARTIPFINQFVDLNEGLANKIDVIEKNIAKTLEGVDTNFQFAFKGLGEKEVNEQISNIRFFEKQLALNLTKAGFDLDMATEAARRWANNTILEFRNVTKETKDELKGFGENVQEVIGNEFSQALEAISKGGLEKLLEGLKQKQAELNFEFDKIGGSIVGVDEMTDAQKELKSEIDLAGQKIKFLNNAIARLGDEGVQNIKKLSGAGNEFTQELDKMAKEYEEFLAKLREKDFQDNITEELIQKELDIRLKAIAELGDAKATEREKDKQQRARDLEDIKENEEKRKEIISNSLTVIGEIVRGFADLRIQQISDELNALQHKQDREIELINQSAASEEQKAARIQAVNAKFDAKERQLKNQQLQAEKQAALFKIAIQTAQNIVEAGGNPILIAAAIALGLTQSAFVAAQKVPQFDKGTKSTPDTFIAGEKKPELGIKDGKAFLIDQPTLFTGMRGTEIVPNDMMMKILASSLVGDISRDSRQEKTPELVNTMNKGFKSVVKSINKKPVYLGNGTIQVNQTRINKLNRLRNR